MNGSLCGWRHVGISHCQHCELPDTGIKATFTLMTCLEVRSIWDNTYLGSIHHNPVTSEPSTIINLRSFNQKQNYAVSVMCFLLQIQGWVLGQKYEMGGKLWIWYISSSISKLTLSIVFGETGDQGIDFTSRFLKLHRFKGVHCIQRVRVCVSKAFKRQTKGCVLWLHG